MLNTSNWFFLKKYLIRKENYETSWLGGIRSKWSSPDGAELESSCTLTIEPNDLVKPIHHRMPVIVPDGFEEQWTKKIKDTYELKGLIPITMGWSSSGWILEEINKNPSTKMHLF